MLLDYQSMKTQISSVQYYPKVHIGTSYLMLTVDEYQSLNSSLTEILPLHVKEIRIRLLVFSTFEMWSFPKDSCWTQKRQSCDYRGKTGWLSDEGRQYQSRPIWGHQHEIWFHKTNAVSFLMCLTFTVNEKVLIARWHFFIIWFQKV